MPTKEWKWAGPDLNRRPLARKANVLTRLDDRPFSDLDKVCFIKVWSLGNKYKAVISYTAESKIVTRKTQRTMRRMKVVSKSPRYYIPKAFRKVGEKMISKTIAIGENVVIGKNPTIWNFVVIGNNTRIGKNVRIGSFVDIGKDVVIGDDVCIQSHTTISNGCKIGNNVFIGPNVSFFNDKYPESDRIVAPVVEDDAIIGGGSLILPLVRIEKGAVVGAGMLVTKNIPANKVVVTEAKQITLYGRQEYERRKRFNAGSC